MKAFALVMVGVFLVTLLGAGAMYMTSKVTVLGVTISAVEAASVPLRFEEAASQLREDSVVGTPFITAQELQDETHYLFYTYTFRLENNTALLADMVEIQVTPMNGDVLQMGTGEHLSIPAHSVSEVTATILTAASMHPIREVNITYYLWGIPFTLRTTVQN